MAIARFAKKNAVKKLGYWIGRLSKDSRKIKQILIEKLISLGALRKEERQFLWTFKYNRYPTDDAIGSAISSAIVRLEAAMTAAIVASVAASAAGS
jgi:hypothetical protein